MLIFFSCFLLLFAFLSSVVFPFGVADPRMALLSSYARISSSSALSTETSQRQFWSSSSSDRLTPSLASLIRPLDNVYINHEDRSFGLKQQETRSHYQRLSSKSLSLSVSLSLLLIRFLNRTSLTLTNNGLYNFTTRRSRGQGP